MEISAIGVNFIIVRLDIFTKYLKYIFPKTACTVAHMSKICNLVEFINDFCTCTDMARVKKNAILCKICVPQFDKTTHHNLWFASGFVWEVREYGILPNAPQFGECATFSRHFTRRRALQRGHQSVAHTVGEKRCTCATFSSAATALLHSF